MKPFRFKKISVNQSEKVFRVGTDAVLLGVLSSVENRKNILEIGTGSGVVSLMLSQRNPDAEILALDINEEAAKLAAENFKNSVFHQRLKAIHQDFKNFETEKKYDFIISNPPYFEKNNSAKDVLARQQTELSFENLIKKSAEILSKSGLFSVIIPYENGDYFEKKCFDNKLFLYQKITIFGIKNSVPKRLILEFGFEEKDCKESELIIEDSPRKFSQEYLELTKDFHVFKDNPSRI